MAKLKVRQVAEAKGKTISDLHFDTRLSLATVRRYWYGTSDGKEAGTEKFVQVDLDKLGAIAKALGVKVVDLIEEDWITRSMARSGQLTIERVNQTQTNAPDSIGV